MNIFEIEVHPAADIIPIESDTAIESLASSIKINGLAHPVVVYKGQLLDGRNRLKACRIAGVDPEIREFIPKEIEAELDKEGKELNDFHTVESQIIRYIDLCDNRRDSLKSVKAMVHAIRFPIAVNVGRAGNGSVTEQFSKKDLSYARKVLKNNSVLAQDVVNCVTSLEKAYEKVNDEIEEKDERKKKMETLGKDHPDLHTQVNEETLSLSDAWAVRESRDADQIAKVDGFNRNMKGLLFEAVCMNEKHAATRMATGIHDYGSQFQHRDFKTIDLAIKEITNFRDNLTNLIEELK